MLYHLSSGRLPGRLWWQVQLWQDWPGWRIHIYRKTIIITMITIKEYSESVPLWHLRFLPALAGSLLTPTVYLLITGFPFTSALGEWSFSLLLYLPDTPLTPFTIDANSTPLKMLDNVIILQSSVSHLMLEPLLASWLSSTRRYLHSQGNAVVDCVIFCFLFLLLIVANTGSSWWSQWWSSLVSPPCCAFSSSGRSPANLSPLLGSLGSGCLPSKNHHHNHSSHHHHRHLQPLWCPCRLCFLCEIHRHLHRIPCHFPFGSG